MPFSAGSSKRTFDLVGVARRVEWEDDERKRYSQPTDVQSRFPGPGGVF